MAEITIEGEKGKFLEDTFTVSFVVTSNPNVSSFYYSDKYDEFVENMKELVKAVVEAELDKAFHDFAVDIG